MRSCEHMLCSPQTVIPGASCLSAESGLIAVVCECGSECMPCSSQDCYLVYYLTELAGATFMMFTRTCDNTRKLALMLRNLGFDAIPIHGQMSQPKRLGALNKFKAGERSILVATGASFFSCGLDPGKCTAV